MSLVPTAALIKSAVTAGHGVLAVNVITLEHAEAIAAGAEAAGRPVILQVSHNAVRFHGGRLRPIAAAAAEVARQALVDVALHLDHVEDHDLLRQAADAGFSSAMFDAGALDYAVNVAQTAEAAAWAHDHGLWLEAELGYVGGKPGAPASAHAAGVRTDPDEAVQFVAATGVDALAVAVGNSHAMTARSARLDLGLVARLRAAVPVPLVLHGSSGVSEDELRRAVSAGMVKINVGTAVNMAFTRAAREFLASDQELTDARKFLGPARDAAAAVVGPLLAAVAG